MKTLLSIVGTTGIGKTKLSIDLAKELKTEIFSCDSRQFYKEMPIGTAAPSKEELQEATHHFIGQRSVSEPYSIGQYEHDVVEELEISFKKSSLLILVGGSMMYEKAVLEGLHPLPTANDENQAKLLELWQTKGLQALQNLLLELDPLYHNQVDLQNPRRLLRALDIIWQTKSPYSTLLQESKSSRFFQSIRIGIKAPRELIYERINQRVETMMRKGLLEEVKSLLPFKDYPALQTVGYSELFQYFENLCSLENAVEEIKKNSRRFAKRQLTWYRKENDIFWVDHSDAFEQSMQYLKTHPFAPMEPLSSTNN
ncbi:tRNA (adenosine(37)-N6)-dimethylallyltransferase MiaA [Chryseobacterium sp. A301]